LRGVLWLKQVIKLEECKKIFDQFNENYSEVELEFILQFLNDLADIALSEYNTSYEKGNSIYPCKY